VIERRADAPAEQVRVVTAPAVDLSVHLSPTRDRFGRGPLGRARDDQHRDGSAQHDNASHHSAVPGFVSLRDITVILDDRRILSRVTLDLAPGLTLVRGPNGAGKTTLLRTIAGLVPLSGGERRVDGDVLYIGQRPMLLRGLTAGENLRFYTRFRGGSGADVDAALARWGLPSAEFDRPVERLSAGERRRASLARIETERLDVIALDEPFTELDDDAAARLRAQIAGARDERRTVVVATHAHHELDALASATVTLSAGTRTS
jgi:ABC-type multidrug transport system ATPase subunit